MNQLHPKQQKAFDFDTQFGAAVAGVQSGKTFVGAHWSLAMIAKHAGKSGVIVAPTYKILQQATMKKFFDIAPSYRQYFKEQKGEINLPNGTTVYVRSAENPLGIEGITAHWVWLDEGGQCSSLTWTVLRSRVSMTGGKILITTTPYNMGWLYQQFYVPWKEGKDSNLTFITWKSVDNPYFSQEFYEAEKNRLPWEEFSRRYMGEFHKIAGLIYDLSEDRIIGPINNLIGKAEAKVIGLDWGFRNPTGIIVAYLYDNAWYIVEEWKQSEKTTAEIIQVLHNLISQHKISRVFPDPEAPDKYEECKRAGIPVYEANNDVSEGISAIRQAIHEGRFFVYRDCKETIDEMSMYHWMDQKQGVFEKDPKEQPQKFNDHLMDAMRYAIHSHKRTVMYGRASEAIKPYYPSIGL